MRIALLTTSFLPQVGGMEWKVHYLASEYVNRGHDVIVFAVRASMGVQDRVLPVCPRYRVIWTGLKARGFGRLGINTWLNYRSILGEHFRQPIDILHCHPLGTTSYCGAKIRSATGIPVVVTTSGADVLIDRAMNYGDRLVPHMDRMIEHSLKHVDVIGAVSDGIHKVLVELGTTARIVDIPNGVSWQDFQLPRGKYLHRRLGLGDDCQIILSVGRNIEIKGYPISLAAFARIGHRFPNSRYVIVGRDVSKLRGQASALGLDAQVHLLEQAPISDIAEIMHSADVFLNTSLLEGFAQVNAQALASGLPCVLTDSPGNVDAAKHGGALVAGARDPDSIAACLARLLESNGERESLGKLAHKAGKRYDWRRIAGEYLEVFEELINRKCREGGRGLRKTVAYI